MGNTNSKFDVVERTEILQKDIQDLISGKILMLRIFPLVNEMQCMRWRHPLEKSTELGRYSNAVDVSVNRIGMTLFETENCPDKMEKYFQSAQNLHHTIDQIIRTNNSNPLKELHNDLDRAWSSGCEVETLDGKMMNPGIIRSFEADPEGGLPPHMDALYKDLPMCSEFESMKGQLAANLYLSTPDEGGELEVWNFSPSLEELEDLYSGEYDFIDRNKIPMEPAKVKPRVGELILFRSDCVHCVLPSRGGMRTAASCFIGYYNDEKPLTVWA